MRKLGTPTKEEIKAMNPDYKETSFPKLKGLSDEEIF